MSVDLSEFDPDASCTADDGWFGLPHTLADARVAIVSVPWEVTTSYRRGTARAPERVLEASHQVDLFDLELGDAWKAGFAGVPVHPDIAPLDAAGCADALPVIEAGGAGEDPVLQASLERVNAAGARLNALVGQQTAEVFDRGAIPALLGGDHSVPFGAIREAARRFPGLGVLHLDAHLDLRVAYQGFTWSHASIMGNVLAHGGLTGPLVTFGVRDFGRAEHRWAQEDPRIHAFPWAQLGAELVRGTSWDQLARPMIDALPEHVWMSFDIDGLDPALCPNTGTPVPGGLSWDHLMHVLRLLRESGRTVVGFDLVEVGDSEWDAIIGARLLYQMGCTAILSQR
ncbi:MAG: agmatinase family protein [Myxococcota bacterium]